MANKNFIQKQWNGTGYDELYPKSIPSQVGLGNVDNVQQMPLSYLDTDGTLASDSDVKVPSQKAVKTAIATAIGSVASGLMYKGTFDASTESFTALADASQGDFYKVSVAGTVSGVDFQVGDMLIINKDVTGTPVVADIDKVDNTEAPDILRTGDIGVNVAAFNHDHTGTYEPANANIQTHIGVTAGNPHGTTKTDLSLGNVTNDAQVKKVASSTDNAIPRFDGTNGDTIQDSLVTVDDTGSVNIPTGQSYKINGAALKPSDLGDTKVTVSVTSAPPSNPVAGDMWIEITA